MWLKKKSDENAKVVRRMIELSGNSLEYKILKYKVMIYKKIGWNLFKRDIRIKV